MLTRTLASWRLLAYHPEPAYNLLFRQHRMHMDCDTSTTHPRGPARSIHPLCKRVFILVLLLSVPVLATLARNNWYLPQSNPGHYLTVASKTKVVSCFVAFDGELTAHVAVIFEPQPQTQRIRRREAQPAVPSIALPVSLRRRPPPAFPA